MRILNLAHAVLWHLLPRSRVGAIEVGSYTNITWSFYRDQDRDNCSVRDGRNRPTEVDSSVCGLIFLM